MIRVSNHEDFQNAVFDESTYSQIRYQAIPSNLFTIPMLKKILTAFGRYPEQILQEDTNEKIYLLNEIEVAVNQFKWQSDKNFFLIVGRGRGQLIHGLQQADSENLEEQEETARTMIAKYPRLWCIIDTDIMPSGDSGLGPPNIPNSTNEPKDERPEKEELAVLTETIENLKNEIAHAKNVNQAQAEQIQQQGISYDQARQNYQTLQSKIAAENKNPESRTFDDHQYERETEENYEEPDKTPIPSGNGDDVAEQSSELQSRYSHLNRPPSITTEDLQATHDRTNRRTRSLTSFQRRSEADTPYRRNDISRKDVYRPPSLRQHQFENRQPAEIGEHQNPQSVQILQKELHLARTALSRTQELLKRSRGWGRYALDQLNGGRRTVTPPDSDEENASVHAFRILPSLEDHTCSKRKSQRIQPLESSEEDLIEGNSPFLQRPIRYKAWTLKMLNIQKYNPEQMDIISHVEKVTKILDEADVKPESQKIRLLEASLPHHFDHFEKAVSSRHRQNYRRFSQELVKIMGSKVRVASCRFMECHRQRGEDILRFFFRLCDLFKSSKGLMGDQWQDDPQNSSHIYTLLYEGLYESEKSKLERKLDKYLERGTLTVTRLKKELIEINKMASDKIKGEIPVSKAIMAVETRNKQYNEEDDSVEDGSEETHVVSSEESDDGKVYWEN